MAREIIQKHIDTALKILAKEKYRIGEIYRNDYQIREIRKDEIEFCEKLIQRLFEDNQILKKQPGLWEINLKS